MFNRNMEDSVQNINWHAENEESIMLELLHDDAINVCFSSINLKIDRNKYNMSHGVL